MINEGGNSRELLETMNVKILLIYLQEKNSTGCLYSCAVVYWATNTRCLWFPSTRSDTNEFSSSCKSKVTPDRGSSGYLGASALSEPRGSDLTGKYQHAIAFEIIKKKKKNWQKSKSNRDLLAQMFPALWPWCEHTAGGRVTSDLRLL